MKVNKSEKKLLDALENLGSLPTDHELQRLAYYYPTYYEWEHRSRLLHGYFSGKTLAELVEDKLDAKDIVKPISKQSRGGHTRWVLKKITKTIVRIQYLRYRIEEKLSHSQANAKFLSSYYTDEDLKLEGQEAQTSIESKQSKIRKMTFSKVIKKELTY